MRIVKLSICLALCACAEAPYWVKIDEPWELKEVRVHIVSAVLASHGDNVMGWASRNKDGSCDIYIMSAADNPACLEEHERKHCAGYHHPNDRYSHGCASMAVTLR